MHNPPCDARCVQLERGWLVVALALVALHVGAWVASRKRPDVLHYGIVLAMFLAAYLTIGAVAIVRWRD